MRTKMTGHGEKIHLSTITPVYHGARYLRELARALAEVRKTFELEGYPVVLSEAIFVDDGSIDDSAAVLKELVAEYPWINVIVLSRNYGQHPATMAGILHSCGDWVVTLDEDLQHPPHFLPLLLKEAVLHGCDVVYGGASAVHESHLRDASSRVWKSLLGWLSGNPHACRFSSFRMLRGTIARAAASVAGHDTYFDVALCWFSTRIRAVRLPLKDRRCIAGHSSGYTFRSLLRHARRMLLSSDVKSLRIGAAIGLSSLAGSALLAAFTIVRKVLQPESIQLQGWTSLFVAILFFGGLSSFLLGIVLEYISIVLHQTHGKPTFLVIDRSNDVLLETWLEARNSGPASDSNPRGTSYSEVAQRAGSAAVALFEIKDT